MRLAELMKVIKRVDIIIINDEEAFQLSRKRHIICSSKYKSCHYGPKQIVIKKGEHGAMLFDDGVDSSPFQHFRLKKL